MSLLKLILLGGTLFMVALVVMQRDVGSGPAGFQELFEKKNRMLVMVRGAVNNLGFQIGAPDPPPAEAQPTEELLCPSGFYTQAHLKPVLERPPQDPQSQGEGARAFQQDKMTPKEEKEKEEGMTRNCFNQFASDRISLHRGLGDDTRPPE